MYFNFDFELRNGDVEVLFIIDYNILLSWYFFVWNIYIYYLRIFFYLIYYVWCLWVKMKLVLDDWFMGEGVVFLLNGNI